MKVKINTTWTWRIPTLFYFEKENIITVFPWKNWRQEIYWDWQSFLKCLAQLGATRFWQKAFSSTGFPGSWIWQQQAPGCCEQWPREGAAAKPQTQQCHILDSEHWTHITVPQYPLLTGATHLCPVPHCLMSTQPGKYTTYEDINRNEKCKSKNTLLILLYLYVICICMYFLYLYVICLVGFFSKC